MTMNIDPRDATKTTANQAQELAQVVAKNKLDREHQIQVAVILALISGVFALVAIWFGNFRADCPRLIVTAEETQVWDVYSGACYWAGHLATSTEAIEQERERRRSKPPAKQAPSAGTPSPAPPVAAPQLPPVAAAPVPVPASPPIEQPATPPVPVEAEPAPAPPSPLMILCRTITKPLSMTGTTTLDGQICALAGCTGGHADGDPSIAMLVDWRNLAVAVDGNRCRVDDRTLLSDGLTHKRLMSAVSKIPIAGTSRDQTLCEAIEERLVEAILAQQTGIASPADARPPGCKSADMKRSKDAEDFAERYLR